jgi:WD40 repeat protein
MSQIVVIDDRIEVDQISIDEVNIDNNVEIDKLIDNDKPPHNGKPITNIELSPSGKYIVTYSQEDHSIFDWNVENVKEKSKFPQDGVKCICVSDDKKLVCVSGVSNEISK